MAITFTTMAENQANAHTLYNAAMALIKTRFERYTITTVSGTSKTLALTDEGTILKFTSGSATTLTVPTNASVAFSTGMQIHITRWGSGTLTVTGASTSVVIRSTDGDLAIATQYGFATLLYMGSDEWALFGGLG